MIKLLVPKLSDPRFLFLLFTYSFLYYSITTPGSSNMLHEYLFLAFWCILFDLLLRRIIEGSWAVPISGLIASFGAFIVLDVIDIKYYILVAALAIGSKAFFRINNRHIFNPGNFAIVVASYGLPNVISNGGFLRWDGNVLHSLWIFALGALLAVKVNRWMAAVSFIFVSLLISPVQAYLANENPLSYIHTLMWQGTVIFIFFMITDPKTSPNKLAYQFVFGASVAIIAQVMRYSDYRLPEHVALILVCLTYALIDKKINDQKIANAWKTKEIIVPLK